jgi:hypothetical protein
MSPKVWERRAPMMARGPQSSSRPSTVRRRWTELPRYQARTCVRCGRHTVFALEDPVGDWYRCLECGAYAW